LACRKLFSGERSLEVDPEYNTYLPASSIDCLVCPNQNTDNGQCDEIRPECKKCINFGVTCNYDTKTPDLQMSLGKGAPAIINNLAHKVHAHKVAANKPTSGFTNPAIFGQGVFKFSAILAPSFASESILLDKDSLGLLDRFKNRTISTLGTSRTAPIYKDVSVREAFAVCTQCLSNVVSR
jgi:hypothetical protein